MRDPRFLGNGLGWLCTIWNTLEYTNPCLCWLYTYFLMVRSPGASSIFAAHLNHFVGVPSHLLIKTQIQLYIYTTYIYIYIYNIYIIYIPNWIQFADILCCLCCLLSILSFGPFGGYKVTNAFLTHSYVRKPLCVWVMGIGSRSWESHFMGNPTRMVLKKTYYENGLD